MKKHEANFSIKFRHWLMKNPLPFGCWFEMKDTRGKDLFPLKEWKDEQREFAEALRYSKKGVLVRTEGVEGLPDYKYAYQETTFIVIKYNQGFVLVDSDTLMMQKGKSLSWEKIGDIAWKIINN
jgi:penicillin-binding protein-related factor A (putative recombinase)